VRHPVSSYAVCVPRDGGPIGPQFLAPEALIRRRLARLDSRATQTGGAHIRPSDPDAHRRLGQGNEFGLTTPIKPRHAPCRGHPRRDIATCREKRRRRSAHVPGFRAVAAWMAATSAAVTLETCPLVNPNSAPCRLGDNRFPDIDHADLMSTLAQFGFEDALTSSRAGADNQPVAPAPTPRTRLRGGGN
jgi:hypothetical protein